MGDQLMDESIMWTSCKGSADAWMVAPWERHEHSIPWWDTWVQLIGATCWLSLMGISSRMLIKINYQHMEWAPIKFPMRLWPNFISPHETIIFWIWGRHGLWSKPSASISPGAFSCSGSSMDQMRVTWCEKGGLEWELDVFHWWINNCICSNYIINFIGICIIMLKIMSHFMPISKLRWVLEPKKWSGGIQTGHSGHGVQHGEHHQSHKLFN